MRYFLASPGAPIMSVPQSQTRLAALFSYSQPLLPIYLNPCTSTSRHLIPAHNLPDISKYFHALIAKFSPNLETLAPWPLFCLLEQLSLPYIATVSITMLDVTIQPGAIIFVTGVNGLIGSYIVDELLKKGYNVRGAVRDVEKSNWLLDHFNGKQEAKLNLVSVPDMTVDGCYDDVVKGLLPSLSRHPST